MFKFILPSINLRRSIECWKWNSEYRVYVSTLGHVKNEHKQNIPMKINQRGYCSVYANGSNILLHRLVLMTWRPIPNAEALTVDHINHNKRDNAIINLEWVTEEENIRRAKNDLIVDVPKAKPSADPELDWAQLRCKMLADAQFKKAVWDENADYFMAIPRKNLYFKSCREVVEYILEHRPSLQQKKIVELNPNVSAIIQGARRGEIVYNAIWTLGNKKMV